MKNSNKFKAHTNMNVKSRMDLQIAQCAACCRTTDSKRLMRKAGGRTTRRKRRMSGGILNETLCVCQMRAHCAQIGFRHSEQTQGNRRCEHHRATASAVCSVCAWVFLSASFRGFGVLPFVQNPSEFINSLNCQRTRRARDKIGSSSHGRCQYRLLNFCAVLVRVIWIWVIWARLSLTL